MANKLQTVYKSPGWQKSASREAHEKKQKPGARIENMPQDS